MATRTLATLRKFGQCVCHNTGLLSATLVRNEDNSHNKIVATTCDQHGKNALADKTVKDMKAASGLTVELVSGKAREPEDE